MLRAGWKYILLTFIVFVGAAFVYAKFIATPMYRSEATIYVCPGSDNFSVANLDLARNYVSTYSALIDSDSVMDSVYNSLYNLARDEDKVMNHLYSVSQLRSMKKVSAVDNTEVVCISVTCADPHDAQLIADQIVASAEFVITNAIRAEAYTIVDHARLPMSPCSPVLWKYLSIAGAAALALCLLIMFLIEALDRRIKTHQTLAEVVPVPIVGIIPDFEA